MIMTIMDVCLILFKEKLDKVSIADTGFPQPSEAQIKKAWGEKFYERMKTFNGDVINGEDIDLMQPYMRHVKYTEKEAEYSCQNLKGVLVWTVAMVKFYMVNKDVIPLKNNLAIQERRSQRATQKLEKAQKLLQEKEEEASQATKLKQEAEAKERTAREEFNAIQEKMNQAVALITGLAGENVRWTEQSAQFKSETERLVGDTIILTGIVFFQNFFYELFFNFFSLKFIWF